MPSSLQQALQKIEKPASKKPSKEAAAKPSDAAGEPSNHHQQQTIHKQSTAVIKKHTPDYVYPEAYSFCSKSECDERQELGQVSILESTVECCRLPQHSRILDPRLAVSKFRRSAAGTVVQGKSKQELEACLEHVLEVLCRQAATPMHPPTSLYITAEFLIDRMRALQSDATRISANVPVRPIWHLQFARGLITLQYLLQGHKNFELILRKTCMMMITTALNDFWASFDYHHGKSDHPRELHALQDEILTYMSLIHLSNCILDDSNRNSPSGVLHHFQKHASSSSGKENYPSWTMALECAALLSRQEYGLLLQCVDKLLPRSMVLGRCCLALALQPLRYHAISQYNSSFAKNEAVSDLDQLLICDTIKIQKECESYGLPVESDNESSKTIVRMKAAPMAEYNKKSPPSREDAWVFFGMPVTFPRTDEDGISLPSPEWLQYVIFGQR